jgi:uncharacterized protein with HEPN domain
MVAAGDAIRHYIDGVTFEAFAANEEKRAAVERQVFVIGETATRLPDDWKQRRPAVPWRKIIGLRNLLAQGYWSIDTEELWDVGRNKVPEFLTELRPLLAPLSDLPSAKASSIGRHSF